MKSAGRLSAIGLALALAGLSRSGFTDRRELQRRRRYSAT
jgi:hypothetical protein